MKAHLLILFHRLASKPYRSFKRFLLGLLLFVIGLVPLLYAPPAPWINISALLLMAFGALVAATGYIGILLNRLVRFWQ